MKQIHSEKVLNLGWINEIIKDHYNKMEFLKYILASSNSLDEFH